MKIGNENILCIGEVLWDVLPDSRKPGGAPLNVAIHLARLQHKVMISSRIGDDANGESLLDFMKQNGLSTELVQRDPGLATSEVLVSLDKNNNAAFKIPGPVAWDNLAFSAELESAAEKAGIIIYGSLGSRNEVARDTIIKTLNSEAVKIIDVNLRHPYTNPELVKLMLSYADVAKFNDDELREIAAWDGNDTDNLELLLKWMTEMYQLQMTIVTRGAEGAILFDSERILLHSGYKAEVKDTVGAGDAFLAGFISSLLNGKPTGEALDFACAAGSFVASSEGGTPNYIKSDIEEIINA